MKIFFFSDAPELYYDVETQAILCPESGWSSRTFKIKMYDFARFLKNKYTNPERFENSFIKPIDCMFEHHDLAAEVAGFLTAIWDAYHEVEAYSYQEAFQIASDYWRRLVFSTIRVPEMIKALGHRRIATAGRPVRHKQFSKSGDFLGYHEYDVVFETHEVDSSKLGLRMPIYAVRCWCTTTSNEHWLWIAAEHRNDPLEAIARTFWVHENIVPHIKELKRQGDILLVELKQDVEPRGQRVSLSKEQYFGLLTAQS